MEQLQIKLNKQLAKIDQQIKTQKQAIIALEQYKSKLKLAYGNALNMVQAIYKQNKEQK